MKTNRLLFSVFYLLLFFQSGWTVAQMSATFSTTLNTNCNGSGCSYEGPSILINELMISPVDFDGSISDLKCKVYLSEYCNYYWYWF